MTPNDNARNMVGTDKMRAHSWPADHNTSHCLGGWAWSVWSPVPRSRELGALWCLHARAGGTLAKGVTAWACSTAQVWMTQKLLPHAALHIVFTTLDAIYRSAWIVPACHVTARPRLRTQPPRALGARGVTARVQGVSATTPPVAPPGDVPSSPGCLSSAPPHCAQRCLRSPMLGLKARRSPPPRG